MTIMFGPILIASGFLASAILIIFGFFSIVAYIPVGIILISSGIYSYGLLLTRRPDIEHE
jgi:hypothetical protein